MLKTKCLKMTSNVGSLTCILRKTLLNAYDVFDSMYLEPFCGIDSIVLDVRQGFLTLLLLIFRLSPSHFDSAGVAS